MKKTLALFLALVMVLLTLTSCYVTRPAVYDDVIGTYELTDLQRPLTEEEIPPHEEGEEYETTYDYIARDGVVCYLVILSATDGYFYWKDNDTAPELRHVTIELTPDDEEPDKYSYVHVHYGPDENKFGILGPKGLFAKTKLNAHLGHLKFVNGSLKYQREATWRLTRVNKKSSLDYLYRQVGNIAPVEYTEPVVTPD